ncbi:hypothetical protein [Streptomyces sp. NPDC051546]|uniref:hypothetical protein n=1 Tax=Streptomyces sp. NPDC051546 TaxID=3365655 RepID=UPI0037B9306C
MFDFLLMLIIGLQAVFAVVALVSTFKPGLSERTVRRTFSVLTVVTVLSAVAHLLRGAVIFGTLFAAVSALLLITWGQAPRVLVRWIRARKGEKSKE